MPKRKDLSGKQFSYLTVLEFAGTDSRGHALWNCKCKCGNEKIIPSHKLLSGDTQSCGCMRYKYGRGLTNTRLYHIWRTMKARCLDKNSTKYYRYGGRGITVCDEWRNSFEAFYEWAVSHGYSDELSIDRIDNDGDYCPENCRWITMGDNSKKSWEDRRKWKNGCKQQTKGRTV